MKANTTVGRVGSHFALFSLGAVLFAWFILRQVMAQPAVGEMFPYVPPILEIIVLATSVIGALLGLVALLQKDFSLQVFLSLAYFVVVFIGFYLLYIA